MSRWERYRFWAQSSWVWFQGYLESLCLNRSQNRSCTCPRELQEAKHKSGAGGIWKRQATGSTGSTAGGFGCSRRAACCSDPSPCLLVFNQRPELVYHKIQTWCQAAVSPVSDDRCFPADGGRTVPTSQVFTGAAVINGGGAGREEAEGTP